MENQKKGNSILIGIIIGLIIAIIIGVILFITGTVSFKEDTTNNIDNNQVTEAETSASDNDAKESEEFSNWVDYILSVHILNANISRFRSKDLGDDVDLNKTVTIEKNDVIELLTSLKNNKLTKTWSQGRGGVDSDHLTITYEKDFEKYEFEIYYGAISVDKIDDELKNILENNKITEKNAEYSKMDGSFYYYIIEGFDETIFDKYFN